MTSRRAPRHHTSVREQPTGVVLPVAIYVFQLPGKTSGAAAIIAGMLVILKVMMMLSHSCANALIFCNNTRTAPAPQVTMFQSPEREKRFCNDHRIPPIIHPRDCFNRPNAKSASATTYWKITPEAPFAFQSPEREKRFCNGLFSSGLHRLPISFNRPNAKSASATVGHVCLAVVIRAFVSIAQTRKALLQLGLGILAYLVSAPIVGFNRPNAKSASATDAAVVHVELDRRQVSIAQTRKALLQRKEQSRRADVLNMPFQLPKREKHFCNVQRR